MHNDQIGEVTKRILNRCDQLAGISEMSGGILRQYLTEEHRRGNQLMADWLTDAGLQTWQDAVGNQWGRLASDNPDAPRLVLGSHLDTVPNAGRYDGILGVLLGIELLTHYTSQAPLPFHLDVVGFADEEGTRFGTTLIGSKALADKFSADWLAIADADGVTMQQALEQFGLSPDNTRDAALSDENLLGYWEVHIEQGPVLESLDQPLGIVSGIAGARRANINIRGQAGHAGTTPMNLRQDALAAAAELIQFIEQSALKCQRGEVATVGNLTVKPGATNVIAGYCTMSLDVRALDDSDRDQLIDQIREHAETIATERNVAIAFDWTHEASAVRCDEAFQNLLSDAARHQGYTAPTLPSGAGHDAMAVADITPIAMLFLRSPRGLSHHPEESVIETDVQASIAVMVEAIGRLAQTSMAD